MNLPANDLVVNVNMTSKKREVECLIYDASFRDDVRCFNDLTLCSSILGSFGGGEEGTRKQKEAQNSSREPFRGNQCLAKCLSF